MKGPTKENKNTFTYAFKQQILRAWQPVPTLLSTVIIFIVIGIIFIAFGVALLILSNNIVEVKFQYDGDTPITSPASTYNVPFVITETMKAPVFVYYELDNFYQNHRRYLKSRDSDQLNGQIKTVDQLDDCDPIITNRDGGFTVAFDGTTALNPDAAANPCGLVAKSLFNDNFGTNLENTGTGTLYDIDETGIAWESDVKNKFKAPPNAETIQWTDSTNEHFIVWMRTAATPDFRKLWGKINQDLEPGNYRVLITTEYDVSSFDGKKFFILSTANAFGGKNYFLAIAYLVVGGLALLAAILFFVKDKISPPKHLPKFD